MSIKTKNTINNTLGHICYMYITVRSIMSQEKAYEETLEHMFSLITIYNRRIDDQQQDYRKLKKRT